MNEEKEMKRLLTKYSEASDLSKPNLIIGAALSLVDTVCRHETRLCLPTAQFLRQEAHRLELLSAGPTETMQ